MESNSYEPSPCCKYLQSMNPQKKMTYLIGINIVSYLLHLTNVSYIALLCYIILFHTITTILSKKSGIKCFHALNASESNTNEDMIEKISIAIYNSINLFFDKIRYITTVRSAFLQTIGCLVFFIIISLYSSIGFICVAIIDIISLADYFKDSLEPAKRMAINTIEYSITLMHDHIPKYLEMAQ